MKEARRQGFVSVHRSILDWEWYDNINTYRVFLHLLLTVNFEDRQRQGTAICRGERIFSFATIAREIGQSFQQVRTAVANLESTGEVTRRKTPQGTVITVNNFDLYQTPTSKSASKSTTHQQANQQSGNNIPLNKENKEYIYAHFERFWNAYPKKKAKKKAWEVFIRLNPSEELLEKMLSSIEAAKKAGEWDEIQFVPYPTTWLNGERWEDEASSGADEKENNEYAKYV